MQRERINRYTSIVVVAKRARQIIDGVPPVVTGAATKPVSIAIEELESGKIHWNQKKPV